MANVSIVIFVVWAVIFSAVLSELVQLSGFRKCPRLEGSLFRQSGLLATAKGKVHRNADTTTCCL